MAPPQSNRSPASSLFVDNASSGDREPHAVGAEEDAARRPLRRPTRSMRAYATMLAVLGGAGAAEMVTTTHEAQAATHPDTVEGAIEAPLAALGHIAAEESQNDTASPPVPPAPQPPRILPVKPSTEATAAAIGQVNKSQRIAAQRAAAREAAQRRREAAEREARRNRVVWPVEGTVTSNYGSRWGSTHYGLDIANSVGTPIKAVKRGTVVEAGPASGFGLWVRIEHEDGTITVYGHINEALVSEGETVEAGETVAEVGNRGQSTGPHLHFEVWGTDSRKVNPLAWLTERGARP
ncbi:murein DD-endopeptidase MepM/ murein hydrolase activator NlpD [Saccharopolyspora lacisalsi]|uniref:Murein DD-endopeptidase MepM/ murein hydrolase activator NlpD n=1 Tax=Halosaccharopolyspora lacisalsi TaxID=1000566 RepID=A0A839DUX7_9PSEU|nr:M23 family metallopeptidase [Halosaccharopolyspora lacisalsi]MBA8824066.1 murein DD-endopeptidase MepM/ murein hydrolase activator NlpD [Halosaccharopolyspora lacisalsi]